MSNPLRNVILPGTVQTVHRILAGLRHDEESFADYYRSHPQETKGALAKLEEYFRGQVEAEKMDVSDVLPALTSERLVKVFTVAERQHIAEHVRHDLIRVEWEAKIRKRRALRRRRQLMGL